MNRICIYETWHLITEGLEYHIQLIIILLSVPRLAFLLNFITSTICQTYSTDVVDIWGYDPLNMCRTNGLEIWHCRYVTYDINCIIVCIIAGCVVLSPECPVMLWPNHALVRAYCPQTMWTSPEYSVILSEYVQILYWPVENMNQYIYQERA